MVARADSRVCALPCSNVFDLLKWYNTFTARPEVIGLSKESLALLTEPLEPLRANVSFAQGIGVELLPAMGKMVRNKALVGFLPFFSPPSLFAVPLSSAQTDATLAYRGTT